MIPGFFAAGAMGESGPSVSLDSVSTSSGVSGATVTIAHTTGIGDDRYMQVAISFPSTPPNSSSVTYDGVDLTQIFADTQGNRSLEVWELVNPPSGTADVVIALPVAPTSGDVGATVRTFSNVDQMVPVRDSSNGKSGTGTSISNSVDAESGDMVVDSLCLRTSNTQVSNVNPNSGQEKDSAFNSGGVNAIVSATSHKRAASTSSVSMGWSWVGNDNHVQYVAALALSGS